MLLRLRFIFQFKVFHQFFYRPPSSDINLRNFDPPPQSSGMAQRNLLMKLDIQLPIPILVRAHNGVRLFLFMLLRFNELFSLILV